MIRLHMGIVDDLLAELISPCNATFSVAELARHYGYPLDDLFEIDVDWWTL